MSQEEPSDLAPLIEEIRSRPLAEAASTGSLALINVVPFAGGAIATVLGEFATNRRFEKVCDVLSDLSSRLEKADADPEEHLSKDEIVEVVYETLQAAATASSEEKLEALKNGLGYFFLSPDPFERKQIYLEVLRRITSMELRLLPHVYGGGDPHIIKRGGPEADLAGTAITTALAGVWVPVMNDKGCDRPTLQECLADDLGVTQGDLGGAARLLDGKGLATLGLNLGRSDCKVVEWQEQSLHFVPSTHGGMLAPEVGDTPLEASRTEFGKDFLEFCRIG